MNDALYHEKILSHYYAPQHYGLIEPFDVEVRGENSLCGDAITIRIKFDQEHICGVSFIQEGCAISRAAASLLMEYIHGKTKAEIQTLSEDFMRELLSLPVTQARMKCMTLALDTVRKVL